MPLEAPDALPLAAPLALPVAPVPEPVVLDPLAVEAPLAVPEADPLATLPELPEPATAPEPAPVVDVAPLLPVEVPVAVPEPPPLVSPEPSPEPSICGGFGDPVEHASAPKRTVAVRVFRKLDVIADLLAVGRGRKNVTCSVVRFTAPAGAVLPSDLRQLEESRLAATLVKGRAHVATGDARAPFDSLRADSNLARSEVASVARVHANRARSPSGVCAGPCAGRRAAGECQRRQKRRP